MCTYIHTHSHTQGHTHTRSSSFLSPLPRVPAHAVTTCASDFVRACSDELEMCMCVYVSVCACACVQEAEALGLPLSEYVNPYTHTADLTKFNPRTRLHAAYNKEATFYVTDVNAGLSLHPAATPFIQVRVRVVRVCVCLCFLGPRCNAIHAGLPCTQTCIRPILPWCMCHTQGHVSVIRSLSITPTRVSP